MLQTVHGRGYRFVAEVLEDESHGSIPVPAAAPHEARTDFVGRSDALARLEVARVSAADGEGNLALLVG